ncbi:hypothetical protein BKA80DRAFT_263989 [Phyllosticta citrichinensis]
MSTGRQETRQASDSSGLFTTTAPDFQETEGGIEERVNREIVRRRNVQDSPTRAPRSSQRDERRVPPGAILLMSCGPDGTLGVCTFSNVLYCPTLPLSTMVPVLFELVPWAVRRDHLHGLGKFADRDGTFATAWLDSSFGIDFARRDNLGSLIALGVSCFHLHHLQGRRLH